MPIRAIAFDLDGVLVDAAPLHQEALNEALKSFGKQPISEEDHLKKFNGLPTKKKLEMMGIVNEEADRINRIKQQITASLIKERVKPVPSLVATIQRLHSQYPLVVASNSIRATVDDMLWRAGIAEFFKETLSNEDVSQPKPDPEIYIMAAEKLGLLSSELLVIEDNKNGRSAAITAGAKLCPVLDPSGVTYEYIIEMIRLHNIADGLLTYKQPTYYEPYTVPFQWYPINWTPCLYCGKINCTETHVIWDVTRDSTTGG